MGQVIFENTARGIHARDWVDEYEIVELGSSVFVIKGIFAKDLSTISADVADVERRAGWKYGIGPLRGGGWNGEREGNLNEIQFRLQG